MMGKNATWRNLTLKDIDALILVASNVHPGLPERDEVFAERVRLFPEGCLALTDRNSKELVGYAISHPIRHRQPPDLDSLLGEIDRDAEQYYIHDLAILPAYHGSGNAKEAMKILMNVAERYESTCLVSVYGTAMFWRRFGFVDVDVDESLKRKLLGYGGDAVMLERKSRTHDGVEKG
ncbi:glucosamine 6-phosphate N-acetyltransferase [Parastagonospora nodorum]|nr:glucosamine 6-phosphate N-acetyltransferase [Parastagonospora nodorum]KAH4014920.1 glucosamine 6-phosphate N-acetyltransferase [Parastagonospora nodorum]KAH4045497.1 glucosamine 6-phosphate N-acetyltransferase [Parastagonospora nodorum]KAH4210348.1 glucosamine 6-phosphate N-acetyltransferase [Parastagonospora nodorum]KAH4228252.1 glucosamine 6-phosphate N-acetyltransferase [Parastagonospora nodorum]